jgi:hypothetical protein
LVDVVVGLPFDRTLQTSVLIIRIGVVCKLVHFLFYFDTNSDDENARLEGPVKREPNDDIDQVEEKPAKRARFAALPTPPPSDNTQEGPSILLFILMFMPKTPAGPASSA